MLPSKTIRRLYNGTADGQHSARKHASKALPHTKSGRSDMAKVAGGLDFDDSHCAWSIGVRKKSQENVLRGKCELVVRRIIGKAPGE